jgi:hypothetical protein
MIVSKVQHKQAKPSIAVDPQTSLRAVAMKPDALPSPQETAGIRERAYELYEVCGRKPGHDEQDWLRAEQEILKQRV